MCISCSVSFHIGQALQVALLYFYNFFAVDFFCCVSFTHLIVFLCKSTLSLLAVAGTYIFVTDLVLSSQKVLMWAWQSCLARP